MNRKLLSIRYLSLFLVAVLSAAPIFTGCSSEGELPVITYTVSFKTSNTTVLDTKKIEKGKTVTKPDTPRKSGYTFEDWYTTASFTGAPYSFDTAVTKDLSLYAKFVKLFTVTFQMNQGIPAAQKVSAVSGDKIGKPQDPTRVDYKFEGWYTTASFIGAPYSFDTAVTKDLSLYAKFVKLFTVTFQMNQGIPAAPKVSAVSGDKIGKPQDPTRVDYKFEGWYKDAGFKNSFDFKINKITGNITLYAKWSSNFVTVTFNLKGNIAVVSPQNIAKNSSASSPNVSKKDGYRFDKWYTDTGYTTVYNFTTLVTAATTLYGRYIKQVTVTLHYNDTSTPDVNKKMDTDTAFIQPTPPTREGYTFDKWYTDDNTFNSPYTFSTAPTTDVNLYAKWQSIKYTVSFNVNNGTPAIDAVIVDYNTPVEKPTTNLTKENFVFKDWYTTASFTGTPYVFSTKVIGSFTLYAKFAATTAAHITLPALKTLVAECKQDTAECVKLESVNTIDITDMSGLFENFADFNTDISKWDTSKVTTMASMFSGATIFNQDLSDWDVSSLSVNGNEFFNVGSALAPKHLPIFTTRLPDDVTQLYVEKGNINSNKAILYCNGGPQDTLRTNLFDDLELSDFHEVYVHQTNTYNKELISGLNESLTFERAIKEDQLSVEILYRVAKHFKDLGKEVYIVGHSFGAFIIPSLIANTESVAKKYLIMAGRLDLSNIVWQGFRDRQPYHFKDGITPTMANFPTGLSEIKKKKTYATMRLQAGFGKLRYITLLKNKDLSNVVYAFGEKDESVGRLTTKEIDFLKRKGAKVYAVPNGSHGSMIDSPHKEKLKALLFN